MVERVVRSYNAFTDSFFSDMLLLTVGPLDNYVSDKLWKLDGLWLKGAVTWQPGDHISMLACACGSCCLCVFVHVCVSGCVWGQCSFSRSKASHYNSCTQLRPEKWQVKSASRALGLSHAPHACPLTFFNCTLFLQVVCLWYESLPWGWMACSWMTRAHMSVESSYWMSPQMSCKTAPGLCFL